MSVVDFYLKHATQIIKKFRPGQSINEYHRSVFFIVAGAQPYFREHIVLTMTY